MATVSKTTGAQQLTFLQKAVVLLMSVESNVAGVINTTLSHIGQEKSKRLLKAISEMGKVDYAAVSQVTEEFFELAIERQVVWGGRSVSEKILKDTFGVEKYDDYIEDSSGVFSNLSGVSDKRLLDFFATETDQMVALLLYYFPENKVASLMAQMDVERASRVSHLILQTEVQGMPLLWRLNTHLEELLLGKKKEVGRRREEQLVKLSRVLEIMGEGVRKQVLAELSQDDPTIADALKSHMFSFENIEFMADKDLQEVFYGVEELAVLAKALVDVSESLNAKVVENLSDRVKVMLDDENSRLSEDLSGEEIEEARSQIVKLARQLEESGRIAPLRLSIEASKKAAEDG